MSNWAKNVAETCGPLLELLKKHIRSGPLINMDETTIQVLAVPGRSPATEYYIWVSHGSVPEKPALIYHYAPSRLSQVAAALLIDYKCVVQTDGYAGYDILKVQEDIFRAGCWPMLVENSPKRTKVPEKGRNPAASMSHLAISVGFMRSGRRERD